jgi:NAD(P)-dependent dehydrogenase (short-subunit alcohol dehydrogenase family)
MADPLLAERPAMVSGAGQGIGLEITRSLRAFGAAADLAGYTTGTAIEVGGGR